jgi:hypothetical protein
MALTDTDFGQNPPMSRTFAYVRVSTTGQTTENQIQEIEADWGPEIVAGRSDAIVRLSAALIFRRCDLA